MIALVAIVNIIWTIIALSINYSWKHYVINMQDEYQKKLLQSCGKAYKIGIELGKEGDDE